MNTNDISNFIAEIILLIILYKIIKYFLYKLRKPNQFSTPYKTKNILTENEYKFYKELKKITDENNLIIFPKVGLKDIFEVSNRHNYFSWFEKISRKHIDFLIYDKSLNLKFAIELDDKSHQNPKAFKNDNFKNNLFKNNNITLYRIKAKMEYTEEYILKYLTDINEPENDRYAIYKIKY